MYVRKGTYRSLRSSTLWFMETSSGKIWFSQIENWHKRSTHHWIIGKPNKYQLQPQKRYVEFKALDFIQLLEKIFEKSSTLKCYIHFNTWWLYQTRNWRYVILTKYCLKKAIIISSFKPIKTWLSFETKIISVWWY